MMVYIPFATYLEVLRDVYETYALYTFWVLLVSKGNKAASTLLHIYPDLVPRPNPQKQLQRYGACL